MPEGSSKPPSAESCAQLAAGERDHWAHPQGLVDDRVEIVVLAEGQLGLEPRERVGVVQQQVEGPGEPGRGRLVAGKQQRHQLVAQLAVAHLRAVLEPRRQEQREDVVALGEVWAAPMLGDLGVEQLVGAVAQASRFA